MTTKKVTPNRPPIVVKNIYFEIANAGNPVFQRITQKSIFEDPLSHYWLSRALERVTQLAKHYIETRATIARQFAQKYNEDGDQKDKDGKVIRKWKKGDPITFPDGSIMIEDQESFREAITKLQDEEVSFDLPQIPFNEILHLPHDEEMVILPLMEKVSEERLVELYSEMKKKEDK